MNVTSQNVIVQRSDVSRAGLLLRLIQLLSFRRTSSTTNERLCASPCMRHMQTGVLLWFCWLQTAREAVFYMLVGYQSICSLKPIWGLKTQMTVKSVPVVASYTWGLLTSVNWALKSRRHVWNMDVWKNLTSAAVYWLVNFTHNIQQAQSSYQRHTVDAHCRIPDGDCNYRRKYFCILRFCLSCLQKKVSRLCTNPS